MKNNGRYDVVHLAGLILGILFITFLFIQPEPSLLEFFLQLIATSFGVFLGFYISTLRDKEKQRRTIESLRLALKDEVDKSKEILQNMPIFDFKKDISEHLQERHDLAFLPTFIGNSLIKGNQLMYFGNKQFQTEMLEVYRWVNEFNRTITQVEALFHDVALSAPEKYGMEYAAELLARHTNEIRDLTSRLNRFSRWVEPQYFYNPRFNR